MGKLKNQYEGYQDKFKDLSQKYEAAVKEKMLMKLEKDRLMAKVENLEQNLKQIEDNNEQEALQKNEIAKRLEKSTMKQHEGTAGKAQLKPAGKPTVIAARDPPNPWHSEEAEPVSSHMSSAKPFKGHLMGITCLAFNPKKSIVCTGSDDTTWKLFHVPNGELIMSGEGHTDWIGGVAFHPKGNFLASASGDGTVKVWDFINACCAYTFVEHG